MTQHLRLKIIASVFLLLTTSCETVESEVPGTSTTTLPFAISVQLAWESGDDFSEVAKCEVPENSPVGTNLDCDVIIPEGQLYFSKMKFEFTGSNNFENCSLIVYRPYFYVVSEDDEFIPPGATTDVDCTNASSFPDEIPVECYNGPATLVPEFPKYTGLYQVVAGLDSYSFDPVDSGNKLFKGNNRWTSNSLVNRALTVADVYHENSMRDWTFECRNKWYDSVYSITMNLYDQDTDAEDDPGGALDHFSDWNSIHP